jgi:stage IV sporulation protein A
VEKYDIYQQIAERTQGDIYLGIVGPVRTGKSTFIKKFMDLLVIPNIENAYQRERARDELPQSAAGRTIMTTEPKFVPNEAVEIVIDENLQLKVRLIDCVGYLVKGALGYMENNAPRMVTTPWFNYQIPFGEAAELGTKKVINEHSTIGLVVTTDGTITDLDREEYLEAEKRVISELKEINKPFVIVLNSVRPYDAEALKLKQELEETYSVPVVNVNCAQLRLDDVNLIMEKVLYEFPVTEIGINLPRWMEALDENYQAKTDMIAAIRETFKDVRKVREAKASLQNFSGYDFVKKVNIEKINLGEGSVLVDIRVPDDMFYTILTETTGFEIQGEHVLLGLLKDMARIKREYERLEFALHEVQVKGYGIVTPKMEELSLEEPEIVKQGSKFGVKLRASAPSIHIVRNKQKCKMYETGIEISKAVPCCS